MKCFGGNGGLQRYRLNREGIKLVVELVQDAITTIWQQEKCNFAMPAI